MFLRRHHLAEGFVQPVGQEDRVVAEALVAALWKDEHAVDAALELFRMAVGPDDRESADEMRGEGRLRPALPEFALDAFDRRAKIPVVAAPARRIDAGRAVKRVDAKPGIVGE